MFADELVGCEAFEGLQPTPEVVGVDEGGEVGFELAVAVGVEAFDGCLLDCPVPLPGNGLPANRERDALDLAIRPGVLDLCEPVFDLMLAADAVEDVFEGMCMPVVVGELDAIIRQNDVNPVGHGCDQIAQKRGGSHFPGLMVQFDVSELGGAVPSRAFSMPCQATDADEEIQFAFGRLNLSDINVKIADRVGLERLLCRLVALHLGQAADVVPLQTAVQR